MWPVDNPIADDAERYLESIGGQMDSLREQLQIAWEKARPRWMPRRVWSWIRDRRARRLFGREATGTFSGYYVERPRISKDAR